MINLSNHPSSKWSEAQKNAALLVDGCPVVDLAFPNIDPMVDEITVETLAVSYVEKIVELRVPHRHRFVHLMGEATFVAVLHQMLTAMDIAVCVSTTERKSVETLQPDGTTKKEVTFQFVKFRRLPREWQILHGTGDLRPHFMLQSNADKFCNLQNKNL